VFKIFRYIFNISSNLNIFFSPNLERFQKEKNIHLLEASSTVFQIFHLSTEKHMLFSLIIFTIWRITFQMENFRLKRTKKWKIWKTVEEGGYFFLFGNVAISSKKYWKFLNLRKYWKYTDIGKNFRNFTTQNFRGVNT